MLVFFDLLRDMVVGPEPWRRASHSVVDPTCLARLKWEMECALRTFIEKPSWRQPHYRTPRIFVCHNCSKMGKRSCHCKLAMLGPRVVVGRRCGFRYCAFPVGGASCSPVLRMGGSSAVCVFVLCTCVRMRGVTNRVIEN